MPKIGLVTVLFNSDNLLVGFLKSLSLQTYKNFHLYMIDNTPSDTTDDCIKSLTQQYPLPGFTHIKSIGNVGFAKGNNDGIRAALNAGCEYILQLNNDIEFDDIGFFDTMIKIAITRNEPLIVPKILFYDSRKIWMAGGFFTWWKAMAYHVGENEYDGPKYNNEVYFDFAPGCFMLVRSSLFNEIGLLDENYFVYVEDTDFLYRAVKKGYRVLLCPQLTVLHKVSSSTGGADSIFSIYYGNRNRIYFIRKHYGFFKKSIALSFVLATRAIKYINYKGRQRGELIRGIRDGFNMRLN